MNLIVHQSIIIHTLRVNAVSNASMLQIGCAGAVKSIAQLFNTGGFIGPAPEPGKPLPAGYLGPKQAPHFPTGAGAGAPLVPLSAL